MLLRKLIFLLFILISIAYAIYTARGVLFPPRLVIFSPENGKKISGTRVYFSGATIPNTSVWIDGGLA
ncbi:MAG: hypothetical protein AAB522_01185 [Patescibacteria group bacterium]